MNTKICLAGMFGAAALFTGTGLLACGDKFLVAGRGTRYERPKNARAASVLIYADPSSGLPAALKNVPMETVLKREGHRSTTVETLSQLSATLAGGRFDVVIVASSVAAAVEKLLGGGVDSPVVVAFCVKTKGPEPIDTNTPCAVKTPAKERTLLEAIDKAVERHDRKDRNARKT